MYSHKIYEQKLIIKISQKISQNSLNFFEKNLQKKSVKKYPKKMSQQSYTKFLKNLPKKCLKIFVINILKSLKKIPQKSLKILQKISKNASNIFSQIS